MHVPDKEKSHGEIVTEKGGKVNIVLCCMISGNSKEKCAAEFIFFKVSFECKSYKATSHTDLKGTTETQTHEATHHTGS